MANFIYSAFCDESGESTIEGQIKQCEKNGIAFMELRGFGKELNINTLSVSQAEEMKKIIDASPVRVASIGSGYGKINIKEPFEPHFENFVNTVEVAKILGAKYIRIFSFYFDEEDDFEFYRPEVIARVSQMASYAFENGIIPCHENEKNIYGDIPERCLDLLENCPNLKAVFDPANFVQCGVDTLKAYEMLKDHIEYMHVKDAVYGTNQVVPCGEGEGNLKAILTYLNEREGDLILSLEPHLQVFDGLSNLEEKQDTSRAMPANVFASHSESFAVAAEALKKVIGEIKK